MADDRKDQAAKSQSWWQSAPGMLTAVAGVLSAVAGLLVALHQVGFLDRDKAAAPRTAGATAPVASEAPSTTPPPAPATDDRAARYRVTWPADASVTLSGGRGVATYQILAARAERRGADRLNVTISIRLTNAGPADVGFWNDSFRLLIDGVPRAPTSRLNDSVDARSAKDAEVQFEAPTTTRSLALQISEGKESDTVPLRLEREG